MWAVFLAELVLREGEVLKDTITTMRDPNHVRKHTLSEKVGAINAMQWESALTAEWPDNWLTVRRKLPLHPTCFHHPCFAALKLIRQGADHSTTTHSIPSLWDRSLASKWHQEFIFPIYSRNILFTRSNHAWVYSDNIRFWNFETSCWFGRAAMMDCRHELYFISKEIVRFPVFRK